MIDEKPHRRWCLANGIHERGERIEAFPTISPPSRTDGGDDDVDLIFIRKILQTIQMEKAGTQKDEKRQSITAKYVNDPQSGSTMIGQIGR